jgi:Uma2 family endonuclease
VLPITFIDDSHRIRVPSEAETLAGFRRWLESDDLPDEARICYLKGDVWIDLSKEQLFSHGQVKTKFAAVLTALVEAGQLGYYWVDGVLLSNEAAEISNKPDGVFVSTTSLQTGRVHLVEGMESGYVELEGSPDMVLEVVSDSSVQKDTVVLRQAYWEAGIREYWLADARQEPLTFDILKHTSRGYAATRKQDGWVKSAVFGKAFRLTQQQHALGHPEFTLAVR